MSQYQRKVTKVDPELKNLVKLCASADQNVSQKAQRQLALALQEPLREGVLFGDIASMIFTPDVLEDGWPAMYPLDFVAPGTEGEYAAFTIPNAGALPSKYVEGDYVMVPTYSVGFAMHTNMKFIRNGKWSPVARMLQCMEAAMSKKKNDDAFHTLMAAGVDRNIVIYDSDAAVGLFTKRLVSNMKTAMRRNGGGNSASLRGSKLTDIILSVEKMEDIRNWGIDQIDEITRREIYVANENSGAVSRVFGVNLHEIYELGVGQEYLDYYTNELSGTLGPSSDEELLIGLDLSTDDSFYMPVAEQLELRENTNLWLERKFGFVEWTEIGFAICDNRRVILGSC